MKEGFPEGVAFSPSFFPCSSPLSSQSHRRRGRLILIRHYPDLGSTDTALHLGFRTVSFPFPPPPAAGEGNSALSPLNPGELLIALHNIDSVKCDMKSIIKGEALPPSPPPQVAWLLWTQGRTSVTHMSPLESAKSEIVPPATPSQLWIPALLPFPPSSSPSSLPRSIQGTGLSTMRWHRVALKKGGEPLPPQAWPEE